MSELVVSHCKACEGGVDPLTKDEINTYKEQVHYQWEVSQDLKTIQRKVRFKNYYETMAFVNALAFMAHRENHHPDLEVSYNHCTVHYTTHAVDGLTTNDFICAAKVDQILDN